MDLPRRKSPRLRDFDYSANGAYFITVCTKDKKPYFGSVGADSISARMIERTFSEIVEKYPQIDSPVYTVMPNHFHAIITIARADMESAPTISQIMQSFKRYSTIEYVKLVKNQEAKPFDGQLWQRSFHDHIIRDEKGFLKIWNYIEGNPSRWEEDRFYVKENENVPKHRQ